MVGLLGYAAAGAVQGLGKGLVEKGENDREDLQRQVDQQREDALIALKREWQVNDRAEDRNNVLSDRNFEIGREEKRIDDAADVLSGGKAPERVKYIHGRLVGLGLSPAAASGFVGNLMQESGQGIDPAAVGDGGNALGIAQWNGPRRRALLKFAESKGKSVHDLDTQIDFLGHELQTTESKTFEALKTAKTPEEAAQIVSEVFERPGTPHNDKRRAYARSVARLMSDPNQTSEVRELAAQRLAALQGIKDQGKVVVAGDGYKYWDKTGERVFPDVVKDDPPADEYGRYSQEETKAGREPLSRINYAQAKKGKGLSVTTSDGTIVEMGGSSGNITEARSKTLTYATRAEGALANLDKYASALTSRSDRIAEMDPTGLARNLQSDSFQLARQSGDEFLQAILRKDTGAAITEQEQVLYGATYIPQLGDGAALLEQKRQARSRAIIALKAGMPPGDILSLERSLEKDTNGRIGGDDNAGGVKPPPTQEVTASSISQMSRAEVENMIKDDLTREQIDAALERLDTLDGVVK